MNNDIYEESLKFHRDARGKLEIRSRVPLENTRDLSLAYTPGVAEPCRRIKEDISMVYEYTSKWNSVAVVTDGSAVLGLGNIGPEAALPVMEGKAILFKEFGGVDAFPICLASQEVEDIVNAVSMIAPGFGGINLEDISAPRCFEIERRLIEKLSIPVFHDDQHGTAIVVFAGLINALKVVEKKIDEIRIVISGAGSAGIAITRFLYSAGARNIILCDRAGIVCRERKTNMNSAKERVLKYLAESGMGSLSEAMKDSDVFIGVSTPDIVSEEMVVSMNDKAIVFALSNPIPEIMPEKALKAGAAVVATGRSDMPNQINNLLAFPGVFRGALDARAPGISEEMKLAASHAIASAVPPNRLSSEYIVPSPLDKEISRFVSQQVAAAAKVG